MYSFVQFVHFETDWSQRDLQVVQCVQRFYFYPQLEDFQQCFYRFRAWDVSLTWQTMNVMVLTDCWQKIALISWDRTFSLHLCVISYYFFLRWTIELLRWEEEAILLIRSKNVDHGWIRFGLRGFNIIQFQKRYNQHKFLMLLLVMFPSLHLFSILNYRIWASFWYINPTLK